MIWNNVHSLRQSVPGVENNKVAMSVQRRCILASHLLHLSVCSFTLLILVHLIPVVLCACLISDRSSSASTLMLIIRSAPQHLIRVSRSLSSRFAHSSSPLLSSYSVVLTRSLNSSFLIHHVLKSLSAYSSPSHTYEDSFDVQRNLLK